MCVKVDFICPCSYREGKNILSNWMVSWSRKFYCPYYNAKLSKLISVIRILSGAVVSKERQIINCIPAVIVIMVKQKIKMMKRDSCIRAI